MRCSKCGDRVGSIPMKNINGAKGYYVAGRVFQIK